MSPDRRRACGGDGVSRVGRRAVAGLLAFGLLVGVAMLGRAAGLGRPLGPDPGEYLYLGQVVLHGGTPYVDAVDNKGPVTFLLFAAIRALAGRSTVAVQASVALFAALAALAVAAYVVRFAGRRVGGLAGVVFAAFSAFGAFSGAEPNTEQYGVAPMAGAWWLAARGDSWSAAGAGALVATGALINVGFAAVVIPVAFELWRARGPARRRARLVAAAGGALAVAAPVAVWLGAAGALGAMVSQVLGQAGGALTGAAGGQLPDRVGDQLGPMALVPAWPLFACAAVGVALAARRPGLRAAALGGALWVVVMFVRAKLPSYSYAHHYYPVLPGIAVALSVGAASLTERQWSGRLGRSAGRLAGAAVVSGLFVVYIVIPQVRTADSSVSPQAKAQYSLAAFIDAHTPPHARILIAADAGQLYWLTDRLAASPVFAVTRFGSVSVYGSYPHYAPARLETLTDRSARAIAALPGARIDPDIETALDHLPYTLAYRHCFPTRHQPPACADVWLLKSPSANRPLIATPSGGESHPRPLTTPPPANAEPD